MPTSRTTCVSENRVFEILTSVSFGEHWKWLFSLECYNPSGCLVAVIIVIYVACIMNHEVYHWSTVHSNYVAVPRNSKLSYWIILYQCIYMWEYNTIHNLTVFHGLLADVRVSDSTLLGPDFGQNGKDAITVRNLLLHNAGFPPDPIPNYCMLLFYACLYCVESPDVIIRGVPCICDANWKI